jgi:hypothetical protein
MTHRLWFKLTAAFALVTIIGVIVTVILTRQGAATRFAHFMIDHHMIRPEQMQQTLADYYRQHQGWVDLDTMLPIVVEATSDGSMSDMMGSMMGMHDNRVQIVDQQERVVADTAGTVGVARLPAAAVQRWPILVDAQTVGALLVEGDL